MLTIPRRLHKWFDFFYEQHQQTTNLELENSSAQTHTHRHTDTLNWFFFWTTHNHICRHEANWLFFTNRKSFDTLHLLKRKFSRGFLFDQHDNEKERERQTLNLLKINTRFRTQSSSDVQSYFYYCVSGKTFEFSLNWKKFGEPHG